MDMANDLIDLNAGKMWRDSIKINSKPGASDFTTPPLLILCSKEKNHFQERVH